MEAPAPAPAHLSGTQRTHWGPPVRKASNEGVLWALGCLRATAFCAASVLHVVLQAPSAELSPNQQL